MMSAAPPVSADNNRPGQTGTETPRPLKSGDQDAVRSLFLGTLREFRADAQDVARTIGELQSALQPQATPQRQAQAGALITELSTVIASKNAAMAQRRATLAELFATDPSLYDAYGDEVRTIENLWERVTKLPVPAATSAAKDEVLRTLSDLAGLIRDIDWHVALVTMPARVNQHLRSLSVGGQLDFAAAFQDELPDQGQRAAMLAYLRAHPKAVEGVVDVEHGLIYRSSPSAARRAASYLGLLLLAGPFGFAYAYVISDGIPWLGLSSGWLLGGSVNRYAEVATAYVFVLLGSLLHIGVEAVKQGQRTLPGGFTAIGDWLTWIHVREVALGMGIVIVLLTLTGLAVTTSAGGLSIQVALFAGYSIDSVFGLFVTRFDAGATVGLSSVRKLIGMGAMLP